MSDKKVRSSVIDVLQENESYSIFAESQGCFHFTSDSIVISRENNRYYAEYNKSMRELDSTEMQSLRDFEYELINTDFSFGCTTSTNYWIKYKDDIFFTMDGSCSWGGIQTLKRNLGW